MRKILIIPSWYPTNKEPIAGIFFYEQAVALSKTNDVKILIIRKHNFRKLFKYARIDKIKYSKYNNVDLIELNIINIIPYIENNIIVKFLFLYYLKKVFKTIHWNPNIIHVHSVYPAGDYAYYIEKYLKIPYIITEHRAPVSVLFEDKEVNKIVCKCFNNASRIISVSEGLKKDIGMYINNKVSVIPNMINTNLFKYEKKKDQNDGNINILFIGTLEYRKGIDTLINAFNILAHKKDYKYVLNIIGKGPAKTFISENILKQGLQDRIQFKDYSSRNEIGKLINLCDIFVLPSRKETFGVVIIEAMACGKPVVSTKCGGPEYIITNETGIVVEPDKPDQLANAISYVAEHYSDYNPENIRKYILNNYSQEVISKRISSVYNEIITKTSVLKI